MSTFANREIPAACLSRLDRLGPETPRLWGRMNAHQMVCHLNDSFRAMVGERPSKSVSNPFSRSVVKWVALHTPMSWPKGVPTVPEADQFGGGTPPLEWNRDLGELRVWIETFSSYERFAEHPFFGPLSKPQFMIWAFRHVDHHFRQFGL